MIREREEIVVALENGVKKRRIKKVKRDFYNILFVFGLVTHKKSLLSIISFSLVSFCPLVPCPLGYQHPQHTSFQECLVQQMLNMSYNSCAPK